MSSGEGEAAITKIDTMIALVRSCEFPKIELIKQDSDESLNKLLVETFQKFDKDSQKVKNALEETQKKRNLLQEEYKELTEELEVKKFDENLNTMLIEECKKVAEVLKV
ncbi:hypothetical protein CAEBREN_22978 [Caenorhabditis brenneri]|uniref:Uncharacterized protein n=1 Tax=Caenorhabditis brenneri TaxID=135651 RepID=G0MZ10_CAEBE|nr:hypothetical protein CAEBREN_22978 [Caenorhabditis brenneri]